MLNRAILIGRLTRDPELKYTSNGTAVCNFTLAIDRKFNREETDFIDIVVWRGQAENCANYLGKGRMVAVEGRIQVRTYETQEGQKRKVTEIVADDVKFLDRAGNATGKSSESKTRSGEWDDIGREISGNEIDIVDSFSNDDEIPF